MKKRRTQKNLVIKKKSLIVESVPDFFELKGSIVTNKKPLKSREIHDRFSEYIANKEH